MKIQILYDQGTARISEDGIIFQPPYYFGVNDGISGVYLPNEGPRLFEGRTGGQLASHILSRAFMETTPGMELENILRRANDNIRVISEASGLSLRDSELLPSAAFAVASIGSYINILQSGDSLAIWEMKNGAVGGTSNKTFSYEQFLLFTIAELMEKHGGDRQKMWEEFRPILIEKRRANINTLEGGFALLNGQPQFERFWQKFTFEREKIKLLILFSDGFVPFEWTRDVNILAKRVVSYYRSKGLYQVLECTRKISEQKKSLTHEDYPEATTITVEF